MRENLSVNAPIVVAKNRAKVGFVEATQYCPSAVIVAGAARRKKLIENGYVRAYVWIEAGALNIQADDLIGANELMQKIGALICQRVTGGNCNGPGVISPWVIECYPFEGYAIYAYNGDKYRQAFVLNPLTRDVQLSNSPVKVEEKFVDARSIRATIETMPLVDNGSHYAPAQSRAMAQSTNRGALGSELMTQIVRNFQDINEAVQMYLDVIKHGGYIQPRFSPVTLVNNKIATSLAAQGINIFEFCKWALGLEGAKTKSVGGTNVPQSKFAYVGNPQDLSTWHLPLDTPGRAQNALSRINQVKGIPAEKKPAVLQRVRKAAQHHGVNVSAPSSKQKKWRGVAANIDSLLAQLEHA
jgi:hypothetical protein